MLCQVRRYLTRPFQRFHELTADAADNHSTAWALAVAEDASGATSAATNSDGRNVDASDVVLPASQWARPLFGCGLFAEQFDASRRALMRCFFSL